MLPSVPLSRRVSSRGTWPGCDRLDRSTGLQLGLDSADLTRLELCRSPRRDRGFRSDVQAIADYVGVDPRRLAATVRLADSQGLCPVLQHDARPDNLGRAGVSWTRLAFSTARSGE